jgi:uncharacterized RDD family membrane protein YckC
VAEDDLDLAREVVTEQAVDPDPPGAPATDAAGPSRALWVILALVVLAAATLLGRLLALTWQ